LNGIDKLHFQNLIFIKGAVEMVIILLQPVLA